VNPKTTLAGMLLSLALPCTALAGPDASCTGAAVTVSIDWNHTLDRTAQGVVVRLAYPEGLVLAKDETGSARKLVRRLAAGDGGLFEAMPGDTDGDGVDDRVNIGLVTEKIAPGSFAEIRFACRPGASAPKASEFACEPQVSDSLGSVDATCAVTVN
jgi:hypothetical protein